MTDYNVSVWGRTEKVYNIEADSEEEARDRAREEAEYQFTEVESMTATEV